MQLGISLAIFLLALPCLSLLEMAFFEVREQCISASLALQWTDLA
jgi:hypothetical protein